MVEGGIAAYAAMGAIVLLGACFQGVAGIGFSIVCAPVCAIFFPQLVPGPLLILGLPLSILGWWRESRATDWGMVAAALTGRVVGTGVAGVLLLILSAQALSLFFAVCILLAVGLSVLGWRVQATSRSLAVAGWASGIMATVSSVGGPPLAIAMQNVRADVMRATLGCVFTVGTFFALAVLWMLGKLDGAAFGLSLLLMPWLVVGFGLSTLLARRVPNSMLRRILLTFAAVSALGVIAEVLWS